MSGHIVIVHEHIVAWFAFEDQAHKWARENYFGQWLMWSQCKPPEIIPPTDDEIARIERVATEITATLREKPEES